MGLLENLDDMANVFSRHDGPSLHPVHCISDATFDAVLALDSKP